MASEPLADRRLSDWYIRDDAASLRRQAGWVVSGGLALVGGAGIVLLMAATTWSGYVPQALLGMLVGVAAIAGGATMLRQADAHRPRLVPVPAAAHPTRPQPRPTPRPDPQPVRRTRVVSWRDAPRALPPGRAHG